MQGIILNEDGYVTFPAEVFNVIETTIKSLIWHITNVDCVGNDFYIFPFENGNDMIMDGNELYDLVQSHPKLQFVWGVFSGYPKELSLDVINDARTIDVQNDLWSLWEKKITHIDKNATLEIIAFDSTETYVLCDDDKVIEKLIQKFTKAESLTKYLE